jgi:hypothetical protein
MNRRKLPLWRGVEGPRRCLSYRRPSGLFNTEDRVTGASFQRPFATSRSPVSVMTHGQFVASHLAVAGDSR